MSEENKSIESTEEIIARMTKIVSPYERDRHAVTSLAKAAYCGGVKIRNIERVEEGMKASENPLKQPLWKKSKQRNTEQRRMKAWQWAMQNNPHETMLAAYEGAKRMIAKRR